MTGNPVDLRRVVLVDDELAARNNIRDIITNMPDLEVVGEAQDGQSAIAIIQQQQPDIIFLDIEMPKMNGFEVAAAISEINCHLVFVTAFDQYALNAFDTQAIDYLVKPVRPSLVEQCIDKIRYHESTVYERLEKQKAQSDCLVLSDTSGMRVIKHKHIKHIEAIGRYRRIHLDSEGAGIHGMATVISDTSLDEFDRQLAAYNFLRIHRGHIVNINCIKQVFSKSRRHYLMLSEWDKPIPVSRQKISVLKNAVNIKSRTR